MAVSVYGIAKFFEDKIKLVRKGKNPLRSGHISTFGYDGSIGFLHGKVQASMKNTLIDI